MRAKILLVIFRRRMLALLCNDRRIVYLAGR